MNQPTLTEFAENVWAAPDWHETLRQLGLTTFEAVFSFRAGQSLTKPNLSAFRSRDRILVPGRKALYLKRYSQPPLLHQIAGWLQWGRRVSCADLDRIPAAPLAQIGIQTPKIVACGTRWGRLFEKQSFIITEEISGSSLEKRLPDCLTDSNPLHNPAPRRQFLNRLADWVAAFHGSGFRHRDLYLSHIFLTEDDRLVLIDLHRTFRPRLFRQRWRLKDLTQLYYSAPGQWISRTDRLRFYLRYVGRSKLTAADRRLIRKIKRKAWRIADRDIRRGRPVPFAQ
ncbi:MAG TPA: lipopolysaccharide kinase InaA family protein [Anaerohalosphaeraceae bacterium]|nr:lipopolysaccharide kinase InaA family protein [Anaerohalosphaeraceae bacterium]